MSNKQKEQHKGGSYVLNKPLNREEFHRYYAGMICEEDFNHLYPTSEPYWIFTDAQRIEYLERTYDYLKN